MFESNPHDDCAESCGNACHKKSNAWTARSLTGRSIRNHPREDSAGAADGPNGEKVGSDSAVRFSSAQGSIANPALAPGAIAPTGVPAPALRLVRATRLQP